MDSSGRSSRSPSSSRISPQVLPPSTALSALGLTSSLWQCEHAHDGESPASFTKNLVFDRFEDCAFLDLRSSIDDFVCPGAGGTDSAILKKVPGAVGTEDAIPTTGSCSSSASASSDSMAPSLAKTFDDTLVVIVVVVAARSWTSIMPK